MIQHIVLMKVKKEISTNEVARVFDQIQGLSTTIPGIRKLFMGSNTSQEGLARGYSHAFIMEFENADALARYLPHPAHQAVAQQISAVCVGGLEGVLVFDITG